jgi:acyl-CoA synthetase (NDP forming)
LSRDLRALFDPRSVAVLGASNDPAKWGHWLARGALKGEERRSVFLVNRNGGEILGRRAYASLADLPEPPELVVISVPAEAFEESVDAALAAGAKALVGISAGLGEMGPEGQARERAAAERVRAAGGALIGPNCLGIFDAGSELDLSSNEVPSGPIGLVSQSGNLALEIGLLAEEVGLGFSRFVSLGNQADVYAAELVEALAEHEPTRVMAVYLEDFRDGRAFARAALNASEAGKPVVLLTGGATRASARAARSHTGALVSARVAVEAACAASGMERVATPKEAVDVAQALLAYPGAPGRRIAVVADGGGHTVLAADLAADLGLELPTLAERTQAELAAVLPPTAATANPVDLAGGGERDVHNFARVVATLLSAPEIDAVLLTGYFGGYSQYSEEFLEREVAAAEAIAAAAESATQPLLVQTMYSRSPAALALRERGVPVYRELEGALRGLAALVRRSERPPRGVPSLPAPAPAHEQLGTPGYWEARALVHEAGIELVEARRASAPTDVLAAAADLGYPVVLKALGQVHKSDAGGVAVGLANREALAEALANMATLRSSEYSVERTAPVTDGMELLVGVRWDERFGPVLLVGAGGLYAELVRDVAAALAPVDQAQAEDLIRSLRIGALLEGVRGRPRLDIAAAGRAAAALSTFAAARHDLAEIEINPLLVTEHGALALDARVVPKGGTHAA